jgi:hypothetical protein
MREHELYVMLCRTSGELDEMLGTYGSGLGLFLVEAPKDLESRVKQSVQVQSLRVFERISALLNFASVDRATRKQKGPGY